MSRLYADEQFPYEVVEHLGNFGHDVLTVQEAGNEDGTSTVEHFPPQDDLIVLDPDVKIYFPNSESVNSTLRSLIKLIPH